MFIYEIRVKGHLDQHWSSWFDGLAISYSEDGSSCCGVLSLMMRRFTVS
jgi:hypothetical protein